MKTTTTKPTQSRPGPGPVPVVLIRHAQSQWNRENRFTGWADPPLTGAGIAEAHAAGKLLREQGFVFDAAYSSRLQRAVTTLDILLAELGQDGIPRTRAWQLNERHYGALQGLDKGEATARHGEQQVWRWRRGYHDRADALSREDARHSCHDPLCHDIDPAHLPDVENLAQTRERVMRYWNDEIVPRIRQGERLLISAHGNTLRALIMVLANMSVEEVEGFEIPTATPIVYHFNRDGTPLDWQYLEQPDHQAA
ncbi:2,3-bisphosphoglycerate-dependent phosphoglycerate mutase [Thiohalophilus sp.]|uniref:2,3-bisphosphoglycerate-dependent phosphoglycerate mutase n=1 Tax=Thiohalophilus sp. TaxID=3028392 RepID=UPI003A0FF3D8